MKKIKIISIILNIFFVTLLFSENEVSKKINLDVGGETIIKIKDLKGISNAGDIVEDVVLTDGNSFLLRGLTWGETQITAWDMAGNHYVYLIHVDMPKFVKELQTFIEEIEGINVNFLGKNIIVEGQLLRKSDESKLKSILANFPQVKNMVNMTVPDANQIITDALKSELYNIDLKFTFLGEGLMYEGVALTPENKEAAKKIGSFYFNSVYPAIDVKIPDVFVDIYILNFQMSENVSNSKFGNFINASKNFDYKNFVSYTFFDSKSVDQAMEKINTAGRTSIISKSNIKSQSNNKIIWTDQTTSAKFFIEIQPKVFEMNWIDLRVNVGIDQDNKNVFNQTLRLVLKNKQPSAILGLMELLKAANVDQRVIQSFQTLSLFNNDNSKPIIIIASSWNLKE